MLTRRRLLSTAAFASLSAESLLAEMQDAAARVAGKGATEVAADRDFWFRGLRVTPNLYTTLPELDRFVEVMASIAKSGIPKTTTT